MLRALLLTLAILLLFASSAAADCAWVLWQQINAEPSQPMSGWPDAVSCRNQVRRAVDAFDSPLKKGPDSALLAAADGSKLLVTFRCLPDTIDPRAPKGGR